MTTDNDAYYIAQDLPIALVELGLGAREDIEKLDDGSYQVTCAKGINHVTVAPDCTVSVTGPEAEYLRDSLPEHIGLEVRVVEGGAR